MNATPSAAAGGPIQTATLDMARSVLMAAGSPLLVKGLVTGDQWTAIVGGALAVVSAVWSYAAAHPGRTPPLQAIRGLVKGAGQGAAWNADVATLEAVVVPIVEKAVDAQIKARAGILAGPVESVADRETRALADQAVDHLKV